MLLIDVFTIYSYGIINSAIALVRQHYKAYEFGLSHFVFCYVSMAVRDVSVLGPLCVYTGSFVWVYTFVLDQYDTLSPFLHHIRFEKRSDF